MVPREPAEQVRLQLFVVPAFQSLTIDMPGAGETMEIFAIPLRIALQGRESATNLQASGPTSF